MSDSEQRDCETIELPASVFYMIPPDSPGYARLKAMPNVVVTVARPKPIAPAPTPTPAKPIAPLPPLSATDREIIRLRKELGWPIPKCYEGRK